MRFIALFCQGGCNPYEIEKIRDAGAKVNIVDNLHAKIYLTDTFVLVGSANPSTNGLGFEGPAIAGLIELCVASNDIAIVDSWKRFFEENIKTMSRNLSDDDLKRAKLFYNKLKSDLRRKQEGMGVWNPGSSVCDWTTMLDVVNCAQHADDVIRNGAYIIVHKKEPHLNIGAVGTSGCTAIRKLKLYHK